MRQFYFHDSWDDQPANFEDDDCFPLITRKISYPESFDDYGAPIYWEEEFSELDDLDMPEKGCWQ